MKLNRQNPKKRQPNTFQKIRHQKQSLHHRPKKIQKQKVSAVGRIRKPSAKKRQVIIRRKRQSAWKRTQLFFLLLFFVLLLLYLYFRK